MSTDALKIDYPQAGGEFSGQSSNGANDGLLEASPRLRKNACIHTQINRGETWWIIENKETGASYRLDFDAYNVVTRLDGVKTVGRILADLAIEGASETQHVVSLLNQLQAADLLQQPRQAANNQNVSPSPSILMATAVEKPSSDPNTFVGSRLIPV